MSDTDDDTPQKDDEYYSLSEAYDDMKYSFGAKDKAVAGLKLFGKGLFNTGKYLFKEGPGVLDHEVERQKSRK